MLVQHNNGKATTKRQRLGTQIALFALREEGSMENLDLVPVRGPPAATAATRLCIPQTGSVPVYGPRDVGYKPPTSTLNITTVPELTLSDRRQTMKQMTDLAAADIASGLLFHNRRPLQPSFHHHHQGTTPGLLSQQQHMQAGSLQPYTAPREGIFVRVAGLK